MDGTLLDRMLAAIRDFSPYFLIEPLLPGATLVALVLWLSHKFAGGRLRAVRQYLHRHAITPPAVTAQARRCGRALCLCKRACVVMVAWRDGLRQSCRQRHFTPVIT